MACSVDPRAACPADSAWLIAVSLSAACAEQIDVSRRSYHKLGIPECCAGEGVVARWCQGCRTLAPTRHEPNRRTHLDIVHGTEVSCDRLTLVRLHRRKSGLHPVAQRLAKKNDLHLARLRVRMLHPSVRSGGTEGRNRRPARRASHCVGLDQPRGHPNSPRDGIEGYLCRGFSVAPSADRPRITRVSISGQPEAYRQTVGAGFMPRLVRRSLRESRRKAAAATQPSRSKLRGIEPKANEFSSKLRPLETASLSGQDESRLSAQDLRAPACFTRAFSLKARATHPPEVQRYPAG